MTKDAPKKRAAPARPHRPHPLIQLVKLLRPDEAPALSWRRPVQLLLAFCGPDFPPPQLGRPRRYQRRMRKRY